MHFPSSALAAMLRALRGETDVHVVAPALGNLWFARVLALAPGVDPVVGALGALAGGCPELLSPAMRQAPALSAAVASLIGTDEGRRVLPTWVKVAPAGWGESYANALIDIVNNQRCAPWVAAALIGPSDVSAALLIQAEDITHAIQCWGQTTPDAPTAWMDALAPAKRNRLLTTLRVHSDAAAAAAAAARCLPWLPEDHATMCAERIHASSLTFAFNAYAGASPIARTRHADVLAALIKRAARSHLAALTRLAAASCMDTAWTAVAHLLRTTPNDADWVVIATPWDALHPAVQSTILSAATCFPICTAIACACGVRPDPPAITKATAAAFFAAVTPQVWNALPHTMQQAWIANLYSSSAFLAVRSLGPDPVLLAHAELNAALVDAICRRVQDENAVRQALLPVAGRALPLAAIPDVIAALPPPRDPVAFVQITGGSPTMPPALHAWIAAHPNAQAMAAAATALRVAARSLAADVTDRCAALAAVFAGWSSEDATALLATLPDGVVDALQPNADALADALAHPDRKDAFRQALHALAVLPPEAALPARHALDDLTKSLTPSARRQASACLARALRAHGNCFLALVDALTDAYQTEVLPAWNDETRASMRAMAIADPLVAHDLAYALRDGNTAVALDALTNAPFDTLTRVWNLLPETLQHAVIGEEAALLTNVAAPEHVGELAQALRDGDADDALPWLALRLLIDDDEVRRARGVAMLARHPDFAAALLPLLRADARTRLERIPSITVAGADLPPPPPLAPVRRRR